MWTGMCLNNLLKDFSEVATLGPINVHTRQRVMNTQTCEVQEENAFLKHNGKLFSGICAIQYIIYNIQSLLYG